MISALVVHEVIREDVEMSMPTNLRYPFEFVVPS